MTTAFGRLAAVALAWRHQIVLLLVAVLVGSVFGGVAVWKYDRRPDPRVPAFEDTLKAVRATNDSLRSRVAATVSHNAPAEHQAVTSLNAVAGRLIALSLGVVPVRPEELRDMAVVIQTATARIDTVYRTDSTSIWKLQAENDRLARALTQANQIINSPRPASLCGAGGAAGYGLRHGELDAVVGLSCKVPIRLPLIG